MIVKKVVNSNIIMITLLAKICIKNYKEYKDDRVRRAFGVLCGAVGIVLNILLFACKFLAGRLSGSIAITADAFNNLSDAGSSLITMVGFKMAGHKPDPDHPFGHGRIEYISGLLVSVIIIIMAYELMEDSVVKIIHPEATEFSPLIVLILIISILTKLYMSFYNRRVGRRIDSAAMRATATDSLSDTIATSVVLIATLVSHFWGIKIDGYCGAAVSLFVFWAGLSAAKDTVGPLLGQAPEPEFVERIEELVLSHKEQGVVGIHDLVVHDYGPGRVMISLHAEVPSNGNINELHDTIDLIEHELATELECQAVIHMDPIEVNDERTNRLKVIVGSIIDTMNSAYLERLKSNRRVKNPEDRYKPITFHDFRMVEGPTHTNLIFDVVLPFDFDMTDEAVVKHISLELGRVNPNYYAVIDIDKAYA